jgi:hypothetical protein
VVVAWEEAVGALLPSFPGIVQRPRQSNLQGTAEGCESDRQEGIRARPAAIDSSLATREDVEAERTHRMMVSVSASASGRTTATLIRALPAGPSCRTQSGHLTAFPNSLAKSVQLPKRRCGSADQALRSTSVSSLPTVSRRFPGGVESNWGCPARKQA